MSDSRARARLARVAAGLRAGSAGKLPALVLMTDDARLADPLAAAGALPRGSMVVVRARHAVKLEQLTVALLKLARRRGFAVLVAGDPRLAARLGADGIHLPETRAGEAPYWRARFPALLITTSAHALRAVLGARAAGADAVFLSPLFATKSHPGRAALSPLRAGLIARQVPMPVYALGGIDARNASRLAPRSFCGIACISALTV